MVEIGKDILKAKYFLEQGQLVAIPTETVYGLAANALNPEAVRKIFQAKGRPDYNPLILHIGDYDQLNIFASYIPPIAQLLAEKFWPGPLTLVLPKNEIVPDIVTSKLKTVGIRMPDHILTKTLLKTLSFPVAAPSANPFGYVSPTSSLHVKDQLGEKIPYILDGGNCQKGLESTIIGFTENEPVLYRYGAITLEEIEAFLGVKVTTQINAKSKPQSSGMLPYHYAPMTPLTLSDNISKSVLEASDEKLGVITIFAHVHNPKITNSRVLSPNKTLEEAASRLYSSLRAMDNLGLDHIIVEKAIDKGLGKTINDRLLRAAARR